MDEKSTKERRRRRETKRKKVIMAGKEGKKERKKRRRSKVAGKKIPNVRTMPRKRRRRKKKKGAIEEERGECPTPSFSRQSCKKMRGGGGSELSLALNPHPIALLLEGRERGKEKKRCFYCTEEANKFPRDG